MIIHSYARNLRGSNITEGFQIRALIVGNRWDLLGSLRLHRLEATSFLLLHFK